MNTRTLIWDWPVRIFHWALAASFAGAWLTAESERWSGLHIAFGYTMAGLIAFRVVWGLVGTRHARFSDFVRGPQAVLRYMRSLLSSAPEAHAGHNPVGAMAVVTLLGLGLVTTLSGWMMWNEMGGEWLEEVHEILATVMLVIVGIHVAGVLFSSWRHDENLIAGMVTGHKPGHSGEGIRHARPLIGLLLLLALGGYWGWTLTRPAPVTLEPERSTPLPSTNDRHDDDD